MKHQPSVTIVGAGCIGRILASSLGSSGADVKVLTRTPQSAKKLVECGLTVRRNGGVPVHVPCSATNNPGAIITNRTDVVFVCVKGPDTREVFKSLSPCISQGTPVILVQNGAGAYDEAADYVERSQLFCGIASFGGCMMPDGTVSQYGATSLKVVPCPDAAQVKPGILVHLPGVPVCYEENSLSVIWSKLCLSCGVNPVTAIYRIKNGDLPDTKEAWDLALCAANEAYRTALVSGIELLYDDVASELQRLCRNTDGNNSSMLQDVNRRRRTEIEYINGFVIRQAQACGVDAPCNRTLYQKIICL